MLTRPEMPRAQSTDLQVFLEAGQSMIRRRSLVFVVSDFISQPGWERPLSMLAQHNEILAVRLYDPLEMQLPDLGMVVVQDAETGEQLFVDTHDRGFRKRFAKLAEEREQALRGALRAPRLDLRAH
jgi:hypothetical protein